MTSPISLLALLLLAGCAGTTVVPLSYAPTSPLPSPDADPVVAVATVTDARGGEPNALGSALGTLGTPVRSLVSGPATVQAVDQAFVGALSSRGVLAPIGAQRFDLTVKLVALAGQAQLGQVGAADVVVSLVRHDTRQVVYTDEETASARSEGMPSLDSLAFVSSADVAALTEAAMNEVIDRTLDKPGFRAALRQPVS